MLDVLADAEFQSNKRDLEKLFANAMEQIRKRDDVDQVRCRGLMAAVDLNRQAPNWQSAFEAGMHLYGKANMNILAPPYVSTPERLQQALDVYVELLDRA